MKIINCFSEDELKRTTTKLEKEGLNFVIEAALDFGNLITGESVQYWQIYIMED